jgi:hypothetical protein
MFLTVIGGTAALAGKGEFNFNISLRLIMAAALAVISYYAVKWIRNNIELETLARKKLLELLPVLGQAVPDPQKVQFGYPGTVALVAIGAILAVLIAPTSNWCAVLACFG